MEEKSVDLHTEKILENLIKEQQYDKKNLFYEQTQFLYMNFESISEEKTFLNFNKYSENNYNNYNDNFKQTLNDQNFDPKSNSYFKKNLEIFASNSLKYEDLNSKNNSPSNILLELDKKNDICLFTKNEKKILDKFSKKIFKTKDFAFLRKKKKTNVKSKYTITQSIPIQNNTQYMKKFKESHLMEISRDETSTFKGEFKLNDSNDNQAKEVENQRSIKEKGSTINKMVPQNHLINTAPDKYLIKNIYNYNLNKKIFIIEKLNLNTRKKCENLNYIYSNSFQKTPTKNKTYKKPVYIDSFKNRTKTRKKLLDKTLIPNKTTESNLGISIQPSEKYPKIKWNIYEDKKLIKLKEDFPYLTWNQISQFFEKRSKTDCMNRYLKVIDPNLIKGKWTAEEDQILKEWVMNNGEKNWFNLVKSNLLKGRNCKQIRERWMNNLSLEKDKKIIWDENNEKILLEKFLIYGTSWTKISQFIPNTTENIVKNKFYSLLRKIANQSSYLVKKEKGTSGEMKALIITKEENLKYENFEKYCCQKSDNKNSHFENEKKSEFIEELKKKNKKCKFNISGKEITDTYLNLDELDNTNTKINTICQTSIFMEKSDMNLFSSKENSFISNKKPRKKQNYSLDVLLNFLPILLKKKNIDYEKILNNEAQKIVKNQETSKEKYYNSSNIQKENILNSINQNQNKKKGNMKIVLNLINSIKEPFDSHKKIIRKEVITKMKKITNNKFENLVKQNGTYNLIEKKFNKSNSLINKIDISDLNSFGEKDNLILNAYNNFNFNSFGNLSNLNSKLQNLFFSNNNNNLSLNSNNDSFISNENEFVDLNLITNTKLNLNFSNSDCQNKNINNTLNFSDLLEQDNYNILNNSNHSFNKSIIFNNTGNNYDGNETNTFETKNNSNLEIKNLNNKSNGLNRMKSSIMLNLQLNLLNKIIEKVKVNYIQKFFKNFKNNTLLKKQNGISINKNQT